MFTGLIEEMGTVEAAGAAGDGYTLRIAARTVLDDATFGASIAVEGVCLSLTDFGADWFEVGLAPETLRRTTLGALAPGDRVNLERSVLPTTRMGGHYVQGHVDGVGRVAGRRPDGDAVAFDIEVPADLARYIVEKGYVAVDGASLTVTADRPDGFSLMLIAHSQPLVTLGTKLPGAQVNIEVDILAKYTEKLIEGRRT
jgi:riboflavin synthase